MKIFAIRSDLMRKAKNIAYLMYYENEKSLYIEIADDVDEWEVPLLLLSDEFELLTMAKGRCSQDNYYIYPISQKNLPKSFAMRFDKRVEDIAPLKNGNLLVFFQKWRYKNVM